MHRAGPAEADYIGATSGIIAAAEASDADEFIVVTVRGVLYELQRRCPSKRFYFTHTPPTCRDMDMVTLEKVAACLETGLGEVAVDPAAAPQAKLTLDRMLEYAAR